MTNLKNVFLKFVERHWDRKSMLLLGFSGGPDSSALFRLMCKEKIPFEVAHVNHGWREESREEAEGVRRWCEEERIAFHERVLAPIEEKKNLEDRGRQQRMGFFKELIREGAFQAVVLGHHGDDLAETVLKRLFEGSALHKLKALLPVTHVEGLTLWRPFLSVSKKEILDWMRAHNHPFFVDPTNKERVFLRGRMREALLPLLSEHFGKRVTTSLVRIANQAHELSDFVEEMVLPYRNAVTESAEGVCLAFQEPYVPKTAFEWRVVVRDFFDRQGLVPTSPTIDTIVWHVKRRSQDKKIFIGDQLVRLNKSKILIVRDIKL